MKRLTEIANKYSCDKGTESYEKHGYTEVYDELFKELPPPVKMLEIGVMDPRFPGASVKMWKEYFPDLLFVGLDINKDAESLRESGTIIYIGDQNSKEDLLNLLIITGGDYDIIIDDGSHVEEHILTSFTHLFPAVKHGGYYIIEDLHASQAQKYKLIREIVSLYDFKESGLRCEGKLWIIQKL